MPIIIHAPYPIFAQATVLFVIINKVQTIRFHMGFIL